MAPLQATPTLALELQGLTKSYPGVRALDDVSLTLQPGEILGVLGENGAGKTTLIRIVTGVVRPDRGRILVDGREVRLNHPRDAKDHGVSVIHQEVESLPSLSITENLLLGNLPSAAPGVVNFREARLRASRLLELIGLDRDPEQPVGSLPVAERQLLAIGRALSQEARILVMDEPTSALNAVEVLSLHALIRRLREQGTSIIYVTHRLPEVIRLTDRVVVLRDGRRTLATRTADVTVDSLARAMVGRDVEFVARHGRHSGAQPALEVEDLHVRGSFAPISFRINQGEVVALYGLLGAGCTSVTRAIIGYTRNSSGAITVAGQEASIRSPADARRLGIGFVPEERRREGLVLPSDVTTNMALATFSKYVRLGWVHSKGLVEMAERWVARLAVRTVSVQTRVSTLSGGSQQKVILARWLNAESRILVLEEPTRGIDIGAKAEIYELIDQLSEQGVAVLLVTSEIPEVLALADRVIVMSRGRMVHQLDREHATEDQLVKWAAA